jgi:hypothetical protein
MSYVKSSDTENYTTIDWLTRHVAGHFRLFEEFPTKVEFDVVGIGEVEVFDYHLSYSFENEYNAVWMVFKINDKLFKIHGAKDSYGGTDWGRELKPVTEKKEVRYEYV